MRSYYERAKNATLSASDSRGTPGASAGGSRGVFELSTMSREGKGKKKKKKLKHPLSLPGETFYKGYVPEEDMVDQQGRNKA